MGEVVNLYEPRAKEAVEVARLAEEFLPRLKAAYDQLFTSVSAEDIWNVWADLTKMYFEIWVAWSNLPTVPQEPELEAARQTMMMMRSVFLANVSGWHSALHGKEGKKGD